MPAARARYIHQYLPGLLRGIYPMRAGASAVVALSGTNLGPLANNNRAGWVVAVSCQLSQRPESPIRGTGLILIPGQVVDDV